MKIPDDVPMEYKVYTDYDPKTDCNVYTSPDDVPGLYVVCPCVDRGLVTDVKITAQIEQIIYDIDRTYLEFVSWAYDSSENCTKFYFKTLKSVL